MFDDSNMSEWEKDFISNVSMKGWSIDREDYSPKEKYWIEKVFNRLRKM